MTRDEKSFRMLRGKNTEAGIAVTITGIYMYMYVVMVSSSASRLLCGRHCDGVTIFKSAQILRLNAFGFVQQKCLTCVLDAPLSATFRYKNITHLE